MKWKIQFCERSDRKCFETFKVVNQKFSEWWLQKQTNLQNNINRGLKIDSKWKNQNWISIKKFNKKENEKRGWLLAILIWITQMTIWKDQSHYSKLVRYGNGMVRYGILLQNHRQYKCI